jgi:hypothetical protein
MDVGGKKLKVQKASIGPTQVANFDVGITAISGLASQSTGEIEQSSVVQLLNMVTAEELMDNDDYEGTVNPLALTASGGLTAGFRNLRGCPRRVQQVRNRRPAQGPPPKRRQQAVCGRWQDLCQV